MNNIKTIIIAFIFILLGFGWISAIMNIGNGNQKEINATMESAEKSLSKGLPYRAATEYKEALSYSENEEIRSKAMSAYYLAYQENKNVYSEYEAFASESIKLYPKNISYIKDLANLYFAEEEYVSAYKLLKSDAVQKLKDEELSSMCLKAKYVYEIAWTSYSDVKSLANGYYVVTSDGRESYVKYDGSTTKYHDYAYASPVGEDEVRIVSDSKGWHILNSLLGYEGSISFEPEEVGVYGCKLIPIKKAGYYGYYNSYGESFFGKYDSASAFIENEAIVSQDNKAYLIGIEGEVLEELPYSEVYYYSDGSFYDDVYIAKQNGKWHLFNSKKEQVGDLSATDVSAIEGNKIIAYSDGGNWGFANKKGETVIAPAYKSAKGFSNGLAAVFNGEKWGFINEDNVLVIDYQFIDVESFYKGTCLVKTEDDGLWHFLDLYNK